MAYKKDGEGRKGGFNRNNNGGHSGGYNRDNNGGDRSGGFNRDNNGQRPGGYNRDDNGEQRPGGYNRDNNGPRPGGYNRDNGEQRPGGYNRDNNNGGQRPGGYNRDNNGQRLGGYNRDNNGQRPGGYNRDNNGGPRPGGYNRNNSEQRPGGFNRDNGEQRPGGYNRDNNGGPRPGGYNRDNNGGQRPGGYNRGNNGDRPGYNRDNNGPRPGGYNRDGGFRRDNDRSNDRGGFNRSNDRDNRQNGGRKDERSYDRREERERLPVQPAAVAPVAPAAPAEELPYILLGRNAVKEAIKSGRSIDRILVQQEPDGSLREIIALAKERGVPVRESDKRKLDELCLPFGHNGKTGNHQGIVAQVPGVQYCEISDILQTAKERNEPPFVLVLDGIEDPYNLGSILRSAECAGAHGAIIPKRRAVGVTAAVCKASAGASEYVKVAQVSNISGAIARLKEEGLWIAGADMAGEPMGGRDLKGPLALCIGAEGKGLSDLVKKNCDFLVSIPLKGKIESLNASVAAAILLYEKVRQEGGK